MEIIVATLLGFMVGILGTLTGGLIILYQKKVPSSRQGWLLGFSGGIMIAVTIFDLWPEAWHFGGVLPTILGTGLGMSMVNYCDPVLQMIPWYRKRRFSKLTKVGILLGMGIGAHNFPEGVALGATFVANPEITGWLGLALLMAIHNIPEGMVMASAFKLGRVRLTTTIIALIAIEFPMAIGSAIGALVGQISALMISISLGFAGGAMLLLAAKELLPMARKLSGVFWVGTGFATGFLIGIVLVSLIH
jgi:zinc transporter, ZIP family